MRVLKDDKYQAILQAARREFSGRGFKDASMRGIARRAGVGLSNIYNYFRNKDELYRAVVIPAQKELFDFIARQHTEDKVALNRLSPFGHDETVIDRYIDLIDRYRTELKLLLCHSEGSSAAGFRDAFADYLTRVSRNYMEIEKKHYPGANDISPFFLHVLCSWTVSVLGEIVAHDLSRKEVREFFGEYFRFEFAGWRCLTGT